MTGLPTYRRTNLLKKQIVSNLDTIPNREKQVFIKNK